MALTKFLVDVNNIQALSDRPNEDGLDSSELKERFDKAGKDIKSYLNNTLTSEIDSLISTINTYIENERNQEYPVGKIVMFYDNVDHSNYLGFTWQKCLQGKVPVGIDLNDNDFDTISKTGGEKTHTLTINEMPRHKHTSGFRWSTEAGANAVYGSNGTGIGSEYDDRMYAGNSQAHNIMQPYEVVSFWRRIS